MKEDRAISKKRLEAIKLMEGAVIITDGERSIQIGAPFDAFKRSFALYKERKVPMPSVLVAPDVAVAFDMAMWAPEFYVLYNMFFSRVMQLPSSIITIVINPDSIPLATKSIRESIIGYSFNEMRRWKKSNKQLVPEHQARTLAAMSEFMAVKTDEGRTIPVEEFVSFKGITKDKRIKICPSFYITSYGNNQYVVENETERIFVDITPKQKAKPLFQVPKPTKPISRDTLGCVVLGNRSGFSTIGPNTGFLLWINGNGVIYDGPYGTIEDLKVLGIAPEEIKAFVVSHVHEDHIGALVELIDMKHRPMLMTSEPIYRSVLTKIALYTNTTERKAAKLINYKPVYPGRSSKLFGAKLTFFYTAHPIPTIGMDVRIDHDSTRGRIVISGDTYNLAGLRSMKRAGVIPLSMYKRLLHLVPDELEEDSLFFIDAGQAIIHGDNRDWIGNPNRILFYHTDELSGNFPPNHSIAELGMQYTVLPA